MEPEATPPEIKQWRVEEINCGSDVDASIEVILDLYKHYNQIGRYRFQYNRIKDGVGAFYKPSRRSSSFSDKDADRNNRAAFEASQAIAEETGTRAEMYVHSQEYLDSISRESLSGLIGKVGEDRARELLEEETEE